MTSTENLTAAAANLAAARLTSAKYAAHLDDDNEAFLAVAETITEQLDESGLYSDLAFSDLSDAAYEALAARVEELTA